MSETKKLTVADIVSRLDKVEAHVKKISEEVSQIRERNQYMILRCEGLLKALLNADELPDLSAKPPLPLKAGASAEDDSASDLFGSGEVSI